MGNKLLTSRSSSTDEENNQGTFEMSPFRAGYDLMSTTTSAQRKSVECWEFFSLQLTFQMTFQMTFRMTFRMIQMTSKNSTLQKIPQGDEEPRPELFRRKTGVVCDILRHRYSNE